MRQFTDMTSHHMDLYNRWKAFDMVAAILAALGLGLAIIEYELGFQYFYADRENLDTYRYTLRWIVSFLSCLSVLIIWVRYYYKYQWRNLPIPKQALSVVYNNDYTNYMRQNRRKGFLSLHFLFDIIVLGVHPPPFWDYEIWISENVNGSPFPFSAMYLASDFIICKFLLVIISHSVHVIKDVSYH